MIGIFRMAGDRLLSVVRIFLREMKGRAAGRQRYGMHPVAGVQSNSGAGKGRHQGE